MVNAELRGECFSCLLTGLVQNINGGALPGTGRGWNTLAASLEEEVQCCGTLLGREEEGGSSENRCYDGFTYKRR